MNQVEIPFEKPYRYVMDTSVLIDIQQQFSRDVFKSLWKNLEQAAKDEIVIFVKQTEWELWRHSVILAEWVSQFPLYQAMSEEQAFIGQLQEDYPDLIDWNATNIEYADPYLISCAYHNNITIVTQEKWNKSKAKIPTVSKDFGIPCIMLNTFFIDIGWEF
ncbi:MAG: DUF4411 family protein [Lewinellaceae bacterium]|nr:DUF4411 family protein [Lewinellaceae bacterium]